MAASSRGGIETPHEQADKQLSHMAPVKYPRPSLPPVTAEASKIVCKMRGT
jgi:hypothetical protein